MADYGSLQSSNNSYKHPISYFTNLVIKGSNDITESVMTSPTSILDTKPFPVLKNPFWSDTNSNKVENRNVWEKLENKGVSLGLVDILIDEKTDFSSTKTDNKTVIFGSQLRIQVPSFVPHTRNESPKSPGDFGIKTRSSHVGSFSPHLSSPMKKLPFSPGAFINLSASEMELSEDYTCVITYGPNPKTTHIFDDCIVESCCGVVKFSESRKDGVFLSDQAKSYPSDSFLSFCYNCKKGLGQGKDLYMYRGEKAFCSSECRYKEMILEEEELKTSKCNHVYVSS